jgi:hypothetical protein
VNWKTGRPVHGVLDRGSRFGRAPDSVFGSKKRHQFHVGVGGQQVDGRDSSGVDTGLIGDEPHPTSSCEMQRIVQEDIDARADFESGPLFRSEGLHAVSGRRAPE